MDLHKRFFIGDACLCWALNDRIDRETSFRVLSIYRALNESGIRERLPVSDIVPTYNSIALHFDPVETNLEELTGDVEHIMQQTIGAALVSRESSVEGATVYHIPVIYDGEDLSRVAELNNLSIREVIELHKNPEYTVAMIGFLPHYPYLIGLDPRLETPRLDNPRSRIPAGSVAIGGAQAGIYPQDSPGGWNIIGQTRPELLIPVQPGDTIFFEEVDRL